MRIARSTLAFVLMAAIVIAFTPVLGQVNAASKKKTLHLVQTIENTQDGKTTKRELRYNEDGTIAQIIDPDEIQTFTYGKNGKIKSWKSESKLYGNSSATYTWEKGKMIRKDGTEKSRSYTYVYTYKGKKPVKGHRVDKYDGDNDSKTYVFNDKYSIKNHKVKKITSNVKSEGTVKSTFKYKKGNLAQLKVISKDKNGKVTQKVTLKVKDTYKNKRVKKQKSTLTMKAGSKKSVIKDTSTFKYQKLKVKKNKKLRHVVRAQQWALINGIPIDGIPW